MLITENLCCPGDWGKQGGRKGGGRKAGGSEGANNANAKKIREADHEQEVSCSSHTSISVASFLFIESMFLLFCLFVRLHFGL